MRPSIVAFAILIAILIPPVVRGDFVVDIQSGGTHYFWDPANPQTSVFENTNNGVANVMFEDAFIIRVWGNQAPFPGVRVSELTDATTGISQYQGTTNSGDTAVSSWNIVDGAFTQAVIYNVALTQTVAEVNGRPVLDYRWDITNTAGDAGRDIDLFHFTDYDIGTSPNPATATFDGSDVVLEVNGNGSKVVWTGTDAQAHELREVGDGNRLTADILGSTTYELDNDPTSLAGIDMTGAIQWSAISPSVGDTVSFFGQTMVVPEPAAATVVALLGMVGLVRRRRRAA